MKLTKEQIEACMSRREWPTMLRFKEDTDLFLEICRLALIGLEVEQIEQQQESGEETAIADAMEEPHADKIPS